MIFFDTETTGLILPGVEDLTKQPRIIEIAMVRLEGNDQSHFQSLVHIDEPLTPEIVKITGITDSNLVGAPTFVELLPELINFMRAGPAEEIVAHNVEFDQWMLIFELRRCGWEHRFPYPQRWTDTVPLSGGKKLANWGKEVRGENFKQSHRALDDVLLLIDCWKSMP